MHGRRAVLVVFFLAPPVQPQPSCTKRPSGADFGQHVETQSTSPTKSGPLTRSPSFEPVTSREMTFRTLPRGVASQ